MKNIKLKTETIQLDQFMKWIDLVKSGGEAKMEIKAGKVMVNGEIEIRRSKKIKSGDIITYCEQNYKII